MDINYISNSFLNRFKEIQNTTKKELYIKDIHELFIIGNFYQLCFGLYYLESNKKYRQCLFCKDENIYNYLRTLEETKRKELIKEIYSLLTNN